MFIITDEKTGGVYATKNKDKKKIVQVFEQSDDAERYIAYLEAEDYPDKLEVMEVDTDIVAMNCDNYGYNYAIIKSDELMIPTID